MIFSFEMHSNFIDGFNEGEKLLHGHSGLPARQGGREKFLKNSEMETLLLERPCLTQAVLARLWQLKQPATSRRLEVMRMI
uniref:Uncharacterized protein n=1 Tax=Glossina morsitans morsitans TaxID=37546 RepID=A0A1B0FCW8_GLOMM